ncbi:MAG TPA: hypothetical protein DDZ80_00790, partial [Cyanobacteria bacterium UBA8803]|nr:hypothetical protein [Cyanobacteria bacterium UBA8803]
LFQAFSQTKTGAKTRQGTGLGLAISQKFVQLMGGEITVSSQVGKGTTFKFDIPVHSVDTGYIETKQPLRRAIALAPNQPRYRILIADDKQDNRQLLLQLLNPFGFELWEASNGVETVEMWQKYSPHLIFMDVRMPVMDGYEASKRIKATTVGQGTAIVALSGTGLEEIRNTLLAAGCDDFIRKPFQEADILDALQAHIGVRYIYDEPTHASTSTATEAGVVLAEALAAFPADLIANFRRAIVALDAELIDTFIARIREQNEPLANALAAWADNFQYEQLLDLIQVIMKNE